MDQSKRKRVAPYRILSNQSLEEIVKTLPQNINELTKVYGLGSVKVNEFGKDIVKMVLDNKLT
jgi:superfamily II DNA helicase RecQ